MDGEGESSVDGVVELDSSGESPCWSSCCSSPCRREKGETPHPRTRRKATMTLLLHRALEQRDRVCSSPCRRSPEARALAGRGGAAASIRSHPELAPLQPQAEGSPRGQRSSTAADGAGQGLESGRKRRRILAKRPRA
nr:unnamed protein product [Digitaria exilis]